MTMARLNELLEALKANGWHLVDPKSMYRIEDDLIEWDIENRQKTKRFSLGFRVFDGLGRMTRVLKDIQSCTAYDVSNKRSLDIIMWFPKITSEAWKNELREFVSEIGKAEDD